MFSATKAYLCTAFKTWAGLEKLDGVPSNLPKLSNSSDSIEIKKAFIEKHIGKFVDEFVLVEFDVEEAWMEEIEERGQQQGVQQQRGQAQTDTWCTIQMLWIRQLYRPQMLIPVVQVTVMILLWVC